jgi:hypothetical protein
VFCLDGGCWVGKNYTFDRRFSHTAVNAPPSVIGRCVVCISPWERYQANKKCYICRMEVLICRECERSGKFKTVKLICHLCGGKAVPGSVRKNETNIVFTLYLYFLFFISY